MREREREEKRKKDTGRSSREQREADQRGIKTGKGKVWVRNTRWVLLKERWKMEEKDREEKWRIEACAYVRERW
jgi:hypothetical protein